MTEKTNSQTPDDLEGAEVIVVDPYAEAISQNKKLHQRTLITFQGGPADGQTMKIPNGVDELTVESPFGNIRYFRLDGGDTFVSVHVN